MSHDEVDSWREDYRHRQQPAATECPDDDTLAELAMDGIDEKRRRPIADHVIRCRRCSDAYLTLRGLHREATAGPSRSWWLRPQALAAGVAVVLVGIALLWVPRSGQEGARGNAEVVRGGKVTVTPADGAELRSPPPRLSWPAQAAATVYRVELFDAEAESLWRSGAAGEPSMPLPAGEEALPLAAGSYYWVVEVEGPVARSRLGPYWFTVNPRP